MDKHAIMDLLTEHKVIKKGHFLRLSGRHSDYYIQCARLFETPATGKMIGRELARLCQDWQIDIVLSAAGRHPARLRDRQGPGPPHFYCSGTGC